MLRAIKSVHSRSGHSSPAGAAAALELRPLWDGHGAQVLTTRWRSAEHPTTRRGSTDFAVIEVMLSGTYEKRCDPGRSLADANTAVLFHPGEEFEISHASCSSNEGLTIRIEADAIHRWLPSSSMQRGERWKASTRIVSPAAMLEAHRLAQVFSSEQMHDHRIAQRRLTRLIMMLLDGGHASACDRAACERIDEARAYLHRHLGSPVRRRDVAEAVGCSPWLLSRQFARQVGLSMHAYLIRLRLRAALRALAAGCDDLTALAVNLGFSSHSHFSAAFKAEFGCSPSSMRQRANRLQE